MSFFLIGGVIVAMLIQHFDSNLILGPFKPAELGDGGLASVMTLPVAPGSPSCALISSDPQE